MRMFKKVKDVLVIKCAVKMFIKVILLFVIFNCGISTASKNTGLLKENENHLLLLSTLDGFFICIERKTGIVRWKLKEEPVIKSSTDPNKSNAPFFLPDPKDGSLYMLNSNDREAISKLPFTIPQLVASSPCRSSDGIMFTGKKLDTWFTVNPESGIKRSFLTYNSIDLTCPREGSDIYIGRTEYNVLMVDPLEKKKAWNVTFFNYFSYPMDSDSESNYSLLHFTGSSSGKVITLDKQTGSLLWQINCESPVVDIYILETRGLLKVPFTVVAEPTLNQIIEKGNQKKESKFEIEFETSELKFFPTLYIGECNNGLYALPSLVDEKTATIALAQKGPLLLEGPKNLDSLDSNMLENDEKQSKEENNFFQIKDLHLSFPKSSDFTKGRSVILLGHYKVPENAKAVLQIEGKPVVRKIIENESNVFDTKKVHTYVQTEDENSLRKLRLYNVVSEFAAGNTSAFQVKEIVYLSYSIIKFAITEQENLEIKVAMILLVIVVFSMAWYFNKQMRDIQQLSQSSKNSESNLRPGLTAVAEEIGLGVVKVGKIQFNAEEILGKGCEGTFVFKGHFDNRSVAVKRVLPECFTFADREVELLRESDYHPNVIRYYCMEQDKQFRYIALELCAATLHDYIEGRFKTEAITPIQILQQAMCGLRHLHTLSIVHRDIKPQNVLLSIPSGKKEVRAMISDFGLCKKLKFGKASFSRRSGITGTDGWIAPEILSGENRATCAVDIFSAGCVFYYVLAKGKHAFGDTLHRQANILSGDYNLSHLEENQLAIMLIKQMIDFNPLNRPTANAILHYPIFWTNAKTLSFFQDVSDRIEKEDTNNFLLKKLEQNGLFVVKGDWRFQIDSEVANDLRKFRNYQGDRVRDLLRALRNKKHHYRELSEQAQKNLGDIPEHFVTYWTNRFPLLLIHTWLTMQYIKFEPVFNEYYDNNYNFLDLSEHFYSCYKINSKEIPFDSKSWLNSAIKNDIWYKEEKSRRKSSPSDLNWRMKGNNWGKELVGIDSLDLKNSSFDFKNIWFQKWMKSNFENNELFLKWREDEINRVNSGEVLSKNHHEIFAFESPSPEVRDKFRLLVSQNSKFFNNYQSPKKIKAKKYFQRKLGNKKQEEKLAWALTS